MRQWGRWCMHEDYLGVDVPHARRAVRRGDHPDDGAVVHRRRADERGQHRRPPRPLPQRRPGPPALQPGPARGRPDGPPRLLPRPPPGPLGRAGAARTSLAEPTTQDRRRSGTSGDDPCRRCVHGACTSTSATTALVSALAGLVVVAAPPRPWRRPAAPSSRSRSARPTRPRPTATAATARSSATTAGTSRSGRTRPASSPVTPTDCPTSSCTTPRPASPRSSAATPRAGRPTAAAAIPAISANGKYVVFQSAATNLAGAAYAGDTIGELVYRYSIANGRIKLVSKSPSGALPSTFATVAGISATGRYVAYSSRAHNIVPGDHNSGPDAFRYDSTTDMTIKVSRTLGGQETDKYSYASAISGNGRYVAWTDQRRRTWAPPTPTTTTTPTSSTSTPARPRSSATTAAARPSAVGPPASATTARSSASPRTPTRSRPATPTRTTAPSSTARPPTR